MAAPVPEAPAVTPGQAAYEAWWADAEPAWYEPWGELPPHARQRWEASAEAVAAPLRAERDQLQRQLADIQHGAGAWVRDATADLTAQRDADRDRLEGERDQWRDAHNALSRKNAELAAELKQAREQLTTTQAIARAMQALAIEILDELDQWELLVEDDRRDAWRKRAGLEG